MKTSTSIDLLRGPARAPRMGGMIFLSLALHLLGISAVFMVPNLSSSRTYYSPVYSVRLVSTPAVSPPAEPARRTYKDVVPAAAPEPEKAKPVEKAKSREKEKPVSLASKALAEKKIAEAIEKVRQRQEEKSLDSAIERLRSAKESRQVSSAIEGIRKRVTIGSTGAVPAEESSSGGASSGILSIRYKMYYNLIWQRIRSVWVLPEGALGGKRNLETIIAIRIARDGQIQDIQFEKKSGNAALDDSALRAIKKANPLPPLPAGIEGDKFDVGIRFTPSDL